MDGRLDRSIRVDYLVLNGGTMAIEVVKRQGNMLPYNVPPPRLDLRECKRRRGGNRSFDQIAFLHPCRLYLITTSVMLSMSHSRPPVHRSLFTSFP